MAKKISKSILRNLGSLRKMLQGTSDQATGSSAKKSSGSTPKKSPRAANSPGSTPEKPAAAKPLASERSAASAADAAALADPAPGTSDVKQERTKIPNQPWYRHRQRW